LTPAHENYNQKLNLENQGQETFTKTRLTWRFNWPGNSENFKVGLFLKNFSGEKPARGNQGKRVKFGHSLAKTTGITKGLGI